jgi:hypothetical protein
MISGTLAVTTTPQPLSTGINQSGGCLTLQVTTGSPVVVGGKAGVTAGNGIQITTTSAPYSFPQSGELVNLADVYVATLTTTATLMWTLS